MVSLDDIKSKAAQIKQKATGSDDNLGPDRGTMDQLEARRERARMEARKEAKEEQRQQAIEEARQQGRQDVQGPDSMTERVIEAVDNAADAVDEDGGFGGGAPEDMGFGLDDGDAPFGGSGDVAFGGGEPDGMGFSMDQDDAGFGGGDLEDMGFEEGEGL